MIWRTLLLGFFAAAAAAAQDFRLNDVHGIVRSPWPERLGRGYAPVWVSLENEGERAAEVDLRVGSSYQRMNAPEGVARMALSLAPGERRMVELLAPIHRQAGQSSALKAQVGTSSLFTAFTTGTVDSHPEDRVLAWVAPQRLPAGTIERIAEQISVDDPETVRGKSGSAPTSWSYDPEWVAFEVGPDDLPSRAAAWSSVDVAVLDARNAPLTGLQLGPLQSFLHSGGLVVVLGDDSALAALFEGAALPEARFRSGAFGVDGELYRVGFGRLVRLPVTAGELERQADRTALIAAVDKVHDVHAGEGALVPGTGAAHGVFGVDTAGTDLPIGLFVLALLTFTIVVGPVNLFVLKRRGRPGLLVVTIPVISAIASLLILGAGILSQGLGLKGELQSATWLDQRTGRAVTLATSTLTPSLRSPELLPARGTTVHSTAYLGTVSREFTVDHGDGLRLTGGWLPVRTAATLLTTSDTPARVRLEVARKDGGVEVTNSLGVDILQLELRDAAGALLTLPLGAVLEPGKVAKLQPGEATPIRAGFVERFERVPCSYVAVLQRNPFVDTLALSPELTSEHHVVQGVLPAEESQWGK